MSTSADHDADSNQGAAASNEKNGQEATSKANPSKRASKKRTKPAGRKSPAKKVAGRRSVARSRVRKQPQAPSPSRTKSGESPDAAPRDEEKIISQRDLIEKALRRVREQLDSKKELQSSTIGALEKLLKMYRDIVEEEEMPQEIRVLWQEINGESSCEE